MGEMEDIVDLVTLSDDELKRTIQLLGEQEHELSRQRRILHGKLDILRAELVLRLQREHREGTSAIDAHDVAQLSRILAGRGIVTPGEADDDEADDDAPDDGPSG
jgi:hypothetical protein